MNHELLNKKLDKFLKKTSGKELMKEFEKLGYKFIKMKQIKR